MQDDKIIKENEACNNYKFYKTKYKKINVIPVKNGSRNLFENFFEPFFAIYQ